MRLVDSESNIHIADWRICHAPDRKTASEISKGNLRAVIALLAAGRPMSHDLLLGRNQDLEY